MFTKKDRNSFLSEPKFISVKEEYPHLFEFSNLKTSLLPSNAIDKAKEFFKKVKQIAINRNWKNN